MSFIYKIATFKVNASEIISGTKLQKASFLSEVTLCLCLKTIPREILAMLISLKMNAPMKHSGFLSQNRNVMESFQK